MRSGHPDEGLENGGSPAVIDHLAGLAHPGGQILRPTHDHQRRCRVEHGDVPVGRGLPGDHLTDGLGVVRRVPTTQILEGGRSQSQLRRDPPGSSLSRTDRRPSPMSS